MISRLDDGLAAQQALWSLVSIGAFVATLVFVQRPTDLARYKWTLFFVGAVLLLLPLAPGIGRNINGARIWVGIGPLGFQPGEFAKLAFAIFFAAYLAERRELIAASTWRIGPIRLPDPAYLAPIVVAWGVRGAGDGRRARPRLVAHVLHAVRRDDVGRHRAHRLRRAGRRAVRRRRVASWRMFDHVQTRVDIWLDPWADEYGKGWQIVQSLYGLGDGGLTGTGLGRGSPDTIPYAESDFIFAAIGEEMGLAGATAVLIAFLLLIGAGLRVALRTDRPFEKLLADRAHHDRRDPGVHHHRRRHQGRPAHRHHPAVHELRRIVAARELHPARAPDPAERHRRPPPRRAPRRPHAARTVAAWRLRRRGTKAGLSDTELHEVVA
jgi:hypothetical protein